MSHQLGSAPYALWVGRMAIKLLPKQFSKCYLLLLIALSSSFFYLSWCSFWWGGLLCVAIVPMLAIIKLLAIAPKKKLLCLASIGCTLLLWNTLTIWWLYKAAFAAFLSVACCNTLFLSLPWVFYYYMRKWSNPYVAYLGLVTSWLTLEYVHLSWEYWEFSFPWLNLGNGLARLPQWIQWYAYTGVLGGSLWILMVNILLYHLLFEKATPCLRHGLSACFLLPLSISLMTYYSYRDQGMGVEAVVVQPNFDNYTEKDSSSPNFVPYTRQIDRLLTLSQQQLTPTTGLVIWPESAISGGWFQASMVWDYELMQPIAQWLKKHAALALITGIGSCNIYGPTKVTPTAQKYRGYYVDYFNSALHLQNGRSLDIYHKVKRVPGGEFIPYFYLLPTKVVSWLKEKFADIGDIDPCFGKGNDTKAFTIDHRLKVAPIICYELLYGAFVGSSVRKGANLLAVITNDGWWGNTPIYHQFFQYSRLLAIAHRRSMIRAANTGTSGFINQRGEVIAATNPLEATAMRAVVYANHQMTFYSLHGDYIGAIAVWACVLLLGIVCMTRWRIYPLTGGTQSKV